MKSRWCRTFALFLTAAALACGCQSGTMSSQQYRSVRMERYPQPPTERSLQGGDRITIYVHIISQNPEAMVEVVDESGYVKMPNIGLVKIGGLTPGKAEELIENTYINNGIYKKDSVQVAIVPPESVFYVQGYVNRPGPYQFTRNITVLMAISMAGGPTEFAHPRIRKLVRKGDIQVIDARKVRDRQEVDPVVEPGDIIEVPRGIL